MNCVFCFEFAVSYWLQLDCILILFDVPHDYIMKILLMVASLIILGNKIQYEYLQDEIIVELSRVVIQDGRRRCIVLVARWMIDIGCQWRVRLEYHVYLREMYMYRLLFGDMIV